MNDPHVESLSYHITKSATITFDKAPARTVEMPAFRVTVDGYRATVTMIDHFASEEEASEVVERFLHAWEFLDDLNEHNGLRFGFAGSYRDGIASAVCSFPWSVAGRLSHKDRWPDPPEGLEVPLEAEVMLPCWSSYRLGEQPMAAAFLALTVLEQTARKALGFPDKRKRQAAATYYSIDEEVLHTFGMLTSERGGKGEGRKAENFDAPLSPTQREWITAAFKLLMRRTAEKTYHLRHGGPPLRQLTMDEEELPKLPRP